ncbi:MAG: hypothetical protein WCH11_01030, partial [Bdellovibrio sp.]
PAGTKDLREKKIQVLEALILDLLGEDLVWSVESLGAHLVSIGKDEGPVTLAQLLNLQVLIHR